MPVIDGKFIERTPLTAAERPVRWKKINAHILERRVAVEQATRPLAQQLGYQVGAGIEPTATKRQLRDYLLRMLMDTFEFGAREARAEIAALRERNGQTSAAVPVTAARRNPAKQWQPEVAEDFFQDEVDDAIDEVVKAAQKYPGEPVSASQAAAKMLRDQVLWNVGTALNLGRVNGAMTPTPGPLGPPQYAMRSEQLDKGTCPACQDIHGTIVIVDSTEFYQMLPPAFCYGMGRCRGVMVFADGVRDLRGGGEPELPPGTTPSFLAPPPRPGAPLFDDAASVVDTGTTILRDAKVAADEFVNGLVTTLRRDGKPIVVDDIERARQNFLRALRKTIDPLTPDEFARLEGFVAHNASSELHSRMLARFGADRIFVSKGGTQVDDLFRASEFNAARRHPTNRVTQIERSMLPIERREMRPRMGSSANYGTEAVIRHEYAHQVWRDLPDADRQVFRRLFDDVDDAKNLSHYGAEGGLEEMFAELYAVVADPMFRPGLWPGWVQRGRSAFDDLTRIGDDLASALPPDEIAAIRAEITGASNRIAGLRKSLKTTTDPVRKYELETRLKSEVALRDHLNAVLRGETGANTAEHLREQIKAANNRIAGWRKTVKKATDPVKRREAEQKLAGQIKLRDKLQERLNAIGKPPPPPPKPPVVPPIVPPPPKPPVVPPKPPVVPPKPSGTPIRFSDGVANSASAAERVALTKEVNVALESIRANTATKIKGVTVVDEAWSTEAFVRMTPDGELVVNWRNKSAAEAQWRWNVADIQAGRVPMSQATSLAEEIVLQNAAAIYRSLPKAARDAFDEAWMAVRSDRRLARNPEYDPHALPSGLHFGEAMLAQRLGREVGDDIAEALNEALVAAGLRTKPKPKPTATVPPTSSKPTPKWAEELDDIRRREWVESTTTADRVSDRMTNTPTEWMREQEQDLLRAGSVVDREIQRRIGDDLAALDREIADVDIDLAARSKAWNEAEETYRRDIAGFDVAERDLIARLKSQFRAEHPDWEEYAVYRAAREHRSYLDLVAANQRRIDEARRARDLQREPLLRARKRRNELDASKQQIIRDRTAEVLNEIIDLGVTRVDDGWKFTTGGRSGAGKKLLDQCAPFFPRAWIERAKSKPIKATFRAGARGKHTGRGSYADILIGGGDRSKILADPDGFATAVHELAHHIEDVDVRLRVFEWVFYQRRTRASWLEPQERDVRFGSGYGRSETYRPDKFYERYMGKTYGNSPASFYELLSMGMESLWTGSYGMDDEMRHFILGLMSVFGY